MRKITPRFDPPPFLARKVTPPGPARRARIGLDPATPRKAYDTTGVVDRRDPSRPPPEHAPGFSEHRCDPHHIHLVTTRALRLWSWGIP